MEKGQPLMPTLTSYQSLLLDCQPRPIRSEGAYRKALRQVEKLMRPRLSRAESEMVEVLATLIEQYESREHPTPKSPPREMLAHLIEARGAGQAAVSRATGIPQSTVSAVLAGRRKLSTASIAALSAYFHVSPSALMELPP
jgi:HTH-type transcriptional regulator/antitoxin HigA